MHRINFDAADARSLMLPEINKVELVLVGCGGTGSWLAPHLVRIARLFHDLHGIEPRVVFIDKDRVEERNTYRQNFVPAEIGRNKAEALAIRYGLSACTEIIASSKPFAVSDYQHGYTEENTLGIFAGCVDNAAARRELEQTLLLWRQNRFNVLVDCGNNKRSGQVIVGTTPVNDRNPFRTFPGYSTWLPKPSVWHKELANENHAEEKKSKRRRGAHEMSCAEIAMMDQQGLSINATIASIAADYLVHILLTQNLNRFATYVDLDGTMMHRYITPRVIKKTVLKESLKGLREMF